MKKTVSAFILLLCLILAGCEKTDHKIQEETAVIDSSASEQNANMTENTDTSENTDIAENADTAENTDITKNTNMTKNANMAETEFAQTQDFLL
ncbi:MAG: hypothetical protein K2N90_05235 [Lachnospiraceae bacterium]|nr:hypothetical protein [Lachnospiraceae bacterium]